MFVNIILHTPDNIKALVTIFNCKGRTTNEVELEEKQKNLWGKTISRSFFYSLNYA